LLAMNHVGHRGTGLRRGHIHCADFFARRFVIGAMLRAYDKATGKEVGAVYMPAPQTGSPMTYMIHGKQYIVVGVSGGPYSGEYIAYTLPSAGE